MGEKYERAISSTPLNIGLRLFIVSINLILIYLILEIQAVFLIGLIGLAILAILLVNQLFSFLRLDDKTGRIKDYISLSKKFARINSKFSIISIVGLIIATLIISQSIILSTTYQQTSLDDFLGGRVGDGVKVYIEGVPDQATTSNWDQVFSSEVPDLNGQFNFNITNINTTSTFRMRVGVDNRRLITDGPGLGNYFIPQETLEPQQWTKEDWDDLTKLPSWNLTEFNPEDRVIILSHHSKYNLNKIASNSDITVLLGTPVRAPNENFTTYDLPIDYAFKPTQEDYDYIIENALSKTYQTLTKYTDKPSFYINLENKWDMYQEFINQELETNDFRNPPIIIVNSFIQMEGPLLSKESIAEFRSRLEQFRVRVNNWVGDKVTGTISVVSPLDDQLEEYQETSSFPLSVLSLLSIGPVLGLSLYLIYFSLSMAEERKQKFIVIMKQRGANQDQLKNMMLMEISYIAFFASLVGMILSIPLVLNLLQLTSGTASITLGQLWLYIPQNWFWRLPLIGGILAIDINISSILRLSAYDIAAETSEPIQPPSQSFLQRIPFDILLFAVSLLIWFIIFFISFANEQLFNIFVAITGPIAIISFFVSFPSVFSRVFGFTISKMAIVLWGYFRGIFTFSIKNLDRHRITSNKILSFFMLGLILMNISLVLPPTFENWGNEQVSYNLGANAYIDGIDNSNQTKWDQVRELEGISTLTEIGKIQLNAIDQSTTILGVNTSTIQETAYWENNFADGNLDNLITSISSPNHIAMQSEVMEALDLHIGDEYVIFRDETHILEITDDFTYFPNLVFDLPRSDSDGNKQVDNIPILTNIETVHTIDRDGRFTDSGAYANIAEGVDLAELQIQIQKIFDNDLTIQVEDVENEKDEFFNTQANQVVDSTFVIMLFLTLIVGAIAQGYFAFLLIQDRQEEIGIFKALGMVKRQITTIFLSEWLILFAFAIISGAIGGVFLSYCFMTILILINQDVEIGPAMELVIPHQTLLIYSAIFMVVGLILFIIPIRRYSIQETQSILRGE